MRSQEVVEKLKTWTEYFPGQTPYKGSWKGFYEWLDKRLMKDNWIKEYFHQETLKSYNGRTFGIWSWMKNEFIEELGLNWFNETSNPYYGYFAFIKSLREKAGLPTTEEELIKEFKKTESYWKFNDWDDNVPVEKLVAREAGSDWKRLLEAYRKENPPCIPVSLETQKNIEDLETELNKMNTNRGF